MATIVIRSRTIEKISRTCCWEYTVTRTRTDDKGLLRFYTKLITKDQAEDIIEENNLVEAHRTEDGEIYDTPDGAFKALFPNGVRTSREKYLIENVDNI